MKSHYGDKTRDLLGDGAGAGGGGVVQGRGIPAQKNHFKNYVCKIIAIFQRIFRYLKVI